MLATSRYVCLFAVWSVAVMTGILSLLREALSIFAPDLAPPRSLFWNCVIIAFVISASILWYLEHKKVTKSHPSLTAKFDFITTAPAGEHKFDSIIVISATIINNGAPSIVDNIAIKVMIEDKWFAGESVLMPKEGIYLHGDGQTLYFRTTDTLQRKGLDQPIPTGGCAAGPALFLIRGVQAKNIIKPTTVIALTFKDVINKDYCFQKKMSESGRLPTDISKLQESNPEPPPVLKSPPTTPTSDQE